MNEKNVIEKLLNDNSIEYSKKDLQTILANELKKDYFDRDYDLINELTESLIIIDGKSAEIDVDANIDKIISRRNQKVSIPKALRIATAACVIFIVLFSVNIVSISAFNIDLFKEVVQFGDNLIKFDFNKTEDPTIELEISMEDPYGLKAEIGKLGINSMLPSYIPEDFELKAMETDGIEDNRYNDLLLHYRKKKLILNIHITEYLDKITENIGIPSENGNLEQINVKGIDIFILSEDGWYKSIFSNGLVVYSVSTNADYETIIKVLGSFE